jgi:maltose-binding protein MalE
MKQKSVFAVIVLVAMITLSACGSNNSSSGGSSSSGGGGSPADAAKGFYDGLYGNGQIDQYVCGSNKASVDAIKQGVDASKSAMAASKATIDVSGLKYEVANQSGDAADVKVSGKLKTTVAGTSTDTDFPPVTLKMKNESGWKVCGMGQ